MAEKKKKNKQKGVIFLDKTLLYVYIDKMSAPVGFKLPQDIVSNLDVLDRKKLSNELVTFIEEKKLEPAQLVIVLSSSVYFEKDLSAIPELEQKAQTESFLSNVPFENVSSKKFKTDKGEKIVAANSDLYTYIKGAFEDQGFQVEAVVPDFASTGNKTVIKLFDSDIAESILKKFDSLKDEGIDYFQSFEKKEGEEEPVEEEKKPKKIRFYLLIGTLLSLFGVLAALVISQRSQTTTVKSQSPTLLLPTPTTTATSPVITEAPTNQEEKKATKEVVVLNLENITVQILNGSGIPGLASKLEDELVELGFEKKNISVGNASSISQRTLVIFSTEVSEEIRNTIVAQLNKTFSDMSAKESTDVGYDVVVTTGRLP